MEPTWASFIETLTAWWSSVGISCCAVSFYFIDLRLVALFSPFQILASVRYISEVKIPKTPVAATLQWLRMQQAHIKHVKSTIITAGLKTEKVTYSRGIKPTTLRSASDSSGFIFPPFPHPGVVAEWWNIFTGAPHSGSCLSSGLGWTRPTPCAPFAQTAVYHSLDYSSAILVPAPMVMSVS